MAKAKKVSVFVVLDRSGSMSGSRWENAIGSINTYVAGLIEDGAKGEVTVTAFDSNGFSYNNAVQSRVSSVNTANLETIRNKVKFQDYNPIEINELSPRGGTPLYDATAQIIDAAEAGKTDRKVILIMTDGEENASREYNLAAIKAKIEAVKSKGWEVVFLGAEFNADILANSMGIDLNKIINVGNKGRFNQNMRMYATQTTAYAATGAAMDTTQLRSAESKNVDTV